MESGKSRDENPAQRDAFQHSNVSDPIIPAPVAEVASGRWTERRQIRTLVLALTTAFGLYLCYRMAAPFLPAMSWALALAVLFAPFQIWLESKLGHRSLAALVAVLVIGLTVVVPATFVGQQLIAQAASGAARIERNVVSGEWRRTLEAQPRLAPLIEKLERQVDLPGIFKTLTNRLSGFAGSFVRGSVYQVIGLCLTFYLLFFFLRDRQVMLRSMRALSPLTGPEMDRLFLRIGDTIHATVYGTAAVSLVQGLLGGLMFWWLGLPAPLLWGVVMAILAVVPVLGAFVVWIPAAIFLGLEGNWIRALILVAWGMLVVGTADNLLRPVLVGKRLKLHTVLVFMSVVGGLILFGAAGLVLGPVALTATVVLLEIWPRRRESGTRTGPRKTLQETV